MKHGKAFGAALIAAGMFTLSLQGQVPSMPSVPGGVPSAPAVPGVPSAPAIPGAPAVPGAPTAPSNIWSQLFPTQAQLQQCKASFCAHPLGQMINSMMQPFTLYSGGLISPCCPNQNQPNPADLAAGADTPEGAVAAIKADEAGAAKRRGEMRYLGTVDCHYWPEAESALIKGLRTDKNECVRWEAANSLGRGCCCTRKTIEALVIAATGSERDGNPAELSEWVKARAIKALNHCMCCYREKPASEPKEKPVKAASKPPSSPPSSASNAMLPPYYAALDKEPNEKIVAEAREALAHLKPSPNAPIPAGRRTVADIMTVAATGEVPHNHIATEATTTAPLKPVPAGTPAAPPAPAPPPPNTDLLHFFKPTSGAHPSSEPPRAAAAAATSAPGVAPNVPQPEAAPQTTATTVPGNAPLPPTGNRDLWHVIQNSISGN